MEHLKRLGALIDQQSKWDELRKLGNSRLVKLTILVPLIGYMILFNDQLLQYLELSSSYFHDVLLQGQTAGGLSLSLAYRLYLFYFGFTFLAIGAVIYELRCPKLVHEYGSAADFVRVEGPITDYKRTENLAMYLGMHLSPHEAMERQSMIMTQFFVQLKSLRALSRWIVLACYYLGFAILTVPTVHSFISVCATVWGKLGTAA